MTATSVFKDERKAEIVRVGKDFVEMFSEISEIYFKWLVQFCKTIKAFNHLGSSDQLSILKSFCFDAICARFGFYDAAKDNGYPMILVCMTIL